MLEYSGVDMKKQTEYKIGEVAALLGINTSVLRFWEKEFPWIVPKRTEKKHRVYTDESIRKVRVIQTLLYDKGMTIEGAKKLLANAPDITLDSIHFLGEENTQMQRPVEGNMTAIIEELEELRSMLSLPQHERK